MERFSISSTIKEYPHLPYKRIKEDILGKEYKLSLVFVGEKKAQNLNQSTRGKSYVPNVLSFPLDENTGEIFIAPAVTQKESAKFKLSPKGYMGYLFIHGLLHLKGLNHGAKMERLEKKFMTKFKLS